MSSDIRRVLLCSLHLQSTGSASSNLYSIFQLYALFQLNSSLMLNSLRKNKILSFLLPCDQQRSWEDWIDVHSYTKRNANWKYVFIWIAVWRANSFRWRFCAWSERSKIQLQSILCATLNHMYLMRGIMLASIVFAKTRRSSTFNASSKLCDKKEKSLDIVEIVREMHAGERVLERM